MWCTASSTLSSLCTATSSVPFGFQNRMTAIFPSLSAVSTSAWRAGMRPVPGWDLIGCDLVVAPATAAELEAGACVTGRVGELEWVAGLTGVLALPAAVELDAVAGSPDAWA